MRLVLLLFCAIIVRGDGGSVQCGNCGDCDCSPLAGALEHCRHDVSDKLDDVKRVCLRIRENKRDDDDDDDDDSKKCRAYEGFDRRFGCVVGLPPKGKIGWGWGFSTINYVELEKEIFAPHFPEQRPYEFAQFTSFSESSMHWGAGFHNVDESGLQDPSYLENRNGRALEQRYIPDPAPTIDNYCDCDFVVYNDHHNINGGDLQYLEVNADLMPDSLLNFGSFASLTFDFSMFNQPVLAVHALATGTNPFGIDQTVIDAYAESIEQLACNLRGLKRPVHLRWAYDIDSSGLFHGSSPDPFGGNVLADHKTDYVKAGFCYIKSRLVANHADNVAMLLHYASFLFPDTELGMPAFTNFNNSIYDFTNPFLAGEAESFWNQWYPGDECVDLVGLSTPWYNISMSLDNRSVAFSLGQQAWDDRFAQFADWARGKNKPVKLTSNSLRGMDYGTLTKAFTRPPPYVFGAPAGGNVVQPQPTTQEEIWHSAMVPMFEAIEANRDIIRWVNHANLCFDNVFVNRLFFFGSQRLEENAYLRDHFFERLRNGKYAFAKDTAFSKALVDGSIGRDPHNVKESGYLRSTLPFELGCSGACQNIDQTATCRSAAATTTTTTTMQTNGPLRELLEQVTSDETTIANVLNYYNRRQ